MMVNLHQALTKSLRRVRPAYCSGYVTAWEERVPNRGPPLDKLHPWPNHEWKHEYKCIRWGHVYKDYTPTARDSTERPNTGNPLNAQRHLLGLHTRWPPAGWRPFTIRGHRPPSKDHLSTSLRLGAGTTPPLSARPLCISTPLCDA